MWRVQIGSSKVDTSFLAVLDVFGGNSVEDSATLGGEDAGVELERVSLLVLLDEF
jgi:hypothetical protein